jgi:hypothetical protein
MENEMTTETEARCELCGDPMPKGEEMFKFHGYSGSCPKPPLQRAAESATRYDQGRRDVLNAILALNPEVSALLAKLHKRDPDPEGRLPFDVVVWVTAVAEQLGIEPLPAQVEEGP